ncbi:Armadillo [Macleaya cordata]|uniref:Armadillo n=1 Tax=Macleaya cordata TaxID=56857 RepID=A0A200QTF4_MACCD|nr:Armadillo [Macleaya cordata]
MDTILTRQAVESLETELKRAFTLIKNSNSITSVKQIEEQTQGLGRCLGLLLLGIREVSTEIREEIGALHIEMMNVKFEVGSEKDLEGKEEDEKEKIERIIFDFDDVVLQIKYGNDEELKFALLGLSTIIQNKMIGEEWINEVEMVPILVKRLGSAKQNNRLTILLILRSLASENDENKEKMVDVGSLSILVKSLARNVEESREAVGLLLALSDILAVRRRIGRIKGCIIMLVALLNGDDPLASHDAGKLLNALSSNTQDVLHMAEAGYFKPLVQHLMEGSDMSKILMATAISRMVLTDQSRASLGEEGSIEPLVKMFSSGKLEAKVSALGALQNLSILTENVQRLVSSGIVATLLKLLFSVTSVLMTLREPASAILASIAQSESILVNHYVAQQMLSLLNLSQPTVQCHLLRALNSIVSHPSASRVRAKMKENGAIQLLLPFLTENNTEIRMGALNLLYNLTKDLPGELTEQLGETYLKIIVDIISTSTCESEKAAAFGLLSNLPVTDKKATDILKKAHILPIIISFLDSSTKTSTPMKKWLLESVAGILILFTVPSDKKLQQLSAEQGIIPWLVKLLSIGSPIAKSRAATSLAQLSQNSLSLIKSRTSKWSCVPPSASEYCVVHERYCMIKTSFCLVKAGAISPLVRILEGKERDADEAVLGALATLMQDEIWVKGSNAIAKASGIEALVRVVEVGTLKAQHKALLMLERIFRVEAHRVQYGELARVILIDLAQKGAPTLKSTIAKILVHLELLQMQSSYF